MKKIITICSALILCSLNALANPGQHPAPVMPKDFETLKKLVGTWEGKAKMHSDKEEDVTVVYELTSGGTAITEKLMPGTLNEMVSIYYKDGKSLAMTHYCAKGNHPEMKLKKSSDTAISFEMVGVKGISSAKEAHMHAITLSMPDANTLKQDWVNFQDGKKNMTAIFSFKRKL